MNYLYCRDCASLEGSALPDPQRGMGRKGSGLEQKPGAKAFITDLLGDSR